MATRKPPEYPGSMNGGEDYRHHDERVGEIRHDVERDEGGPTHDRAGAPAPRSDDTEVDEGEGKQPG